MAAGQSQICKIFTGLYQHLRQQPIDSRGAGWWYLQAI